MQFHDDDDDVVVGHSIQPTSCSVLRCRHNNVLSGVKTSLQVQFVEGEEQTLLSSIFLSIGIILRGILPRDRPIVNCTL
jgi:hypothetical protein